MDGFRLQELTGVLLECSLLQAAFPNFQLFYSNRITPFWYLSQLLLTLPLFCMIVLGLSGSHYGRIYILSLIAIFYYANMGVANVGWGVMGLFRVLAGMSVGALIYDCSNTLHNIGKTKMSFPVFLSIMPLIFSLIISSDLYRLFFEAIPYQDQICVMCFFCRINCNYE